MKFSEVKENFKNLVAQKQTRTEIAKELWKLALAHQGQELQFLQIAKVPTSAHKEAVRLIVEARKAGERVDIQDKSTTGVTNFSKKLQEMFAAFRNSDNKQGEALKQKLFAEHPGQKKQIESVAAWAKGVGGFEAFCKLILQSGVEKIAPVQPKPQPKQAQQTPAQSAPKASETPSFIKVCSDFRNSVFQGHKAAVKRIYTERIKQFPNKKDDFFQIALEYVLQTEHKTPFKKKIAELEAWALLGDSEKIESVTQALIAVHPGSKIDVYLAAGNTTELNKELAAKAEREKAKAEAQAKLAQNLPENRGNEDVVDRLKKETTISQEKKNETTVKSTNDLSTDGYSNYAGKRYLDKSIQTLGLSGASQRWLASGEIPHPNSLPELWPSSSWTVLIDETGCFTRNADPTQGPGKIVAVFVPENVRLKTCKLHAAEEKSFNKIENVVRALLDSRCGVLGVSSDLLPPTDGDCWFDTLIALINLAVRILPVASCEKVTLNIKAERVARFSDGAYLEFIARETLIKLRAAYPRFAENVEVKATFVDKTDDLNGYADVVAYLWGSERWRYLREFTCWEGACLLEAKTNGSMEDFFELLRREEYFNQRYWETLCLSPEYERPASVLSAIMTKYGEQTKYDSARWMEYFERLNTYDALDSVPNKTVLVKQITWLANFLPIEELERCESMTIALCRRLEAGNSDEAIALRRIRLRLMSNAFWRKNDKQ